MECLTKPLMQRTWITQCPLLLLDTRMPYGSLSVGCEEHLDPAGTGSIYNEGEADIVVQHVFSLICSGKYICLLNTNTDSAFFFFSLKKKQYSNILFPKCDYFTVPIVNGARKATLPTIKGCLIKSCLPSFHSGLDVVIPVVDF